MASTLKTSQFKLPSLISEGIQCGSTQTSQLTKRGGRVYGSIRRYLVGFLQHIHPTVYHNLQDGQQRQNVLQARTDQRTEIFIQLQANGETR